MGRIVADIERPAPEIVARFKALGSSILVRSIESPLIADMAIKPLAVKPTKICGPAVTISSSRADLMMGVLATGVAREGDVVVVCPGGDMTHACWGGGLTLSADNRGYEAVVVDGAIEDSDYILTLDTPVFCRGATMRKHELDGRQGSVNVDVVFGGVPVRPGDLIFGDSDGVLVIPREILLKVLEKAEPAAEATRQAAPKLRDSRGVLFDAFGGQALVERLGVEWVSSL
ncbi:MAG: hypothetical protein V4466_02700 [Pseudomonadota bacterium]